MENILPESRTEGTDVKWGIWRVEKLFLCKLAGNTVLFFCRVLYIVKTHGFMSEIIVFQGVVEFYPTFYDVNPP